jgi:hypothetical protein
MNWEGCRRKRSWPNWMPYPDVYWRDWGQLRNISLRLANLWADIWTRDLPNTKQEWTTRPRRSVRRIGWALSLQAMDILETALINTAVWLLATWCNIVALYFCSDEKWLINEADKLLNCGLQYELLRSTSDITTPRKHLLHASVLYQHRCCVTEWKICSYSRIVWTGEFHPGRRCWIKTEGCICKTNKTLLWCSQVSCCLV